MKHKHIVEGIATLTGTIIGAGVLGLPYAVAKSGFLTGTLTLIFLGAVVLIMYLYLGEAILRTKGSHQLTGYAKIYLGSTGKNIMLLTMVLGLYGALTAYLIGSAESLSQIFGGTSVNSVSWLLIYFFIVSPITYIGLRWVERCEVIFGALLLFAVFLIIFFTAPHINPSNLAEFEIKNFFVPFGVILFAYLGAVAIPEMKIEMKDNIKDLKKAIIIGTLIPIILYFVFSLAVVGAVGFSNFNSLEPNERIATIALQNILGKNMYFLGNLFAVFAMTTSFLAVSIALKEMFVFDYRMNRKAAWFLTALFPLVLALSGLTHFIQVLAFTGVLAGGVQSILIILIALKAKKLGNRKPEFAVPLNRQLALFLILIFIAAAVLYFI